MKKFEDFFENILFNSRFLVLVAVISSIVAALIMFVKGGAEVYHAAGILLGSLLHHSDSGSHEIIVLLIESIDNFLFATVLLIFSMGIYELFISEIDPATRSGETRPNWLSIHSLDDLKGAIGKVILMILIVKLFEKTTSIQYTTPLHLLYLAVCIVLISAALYLVHKGHSR